MSLVLKYLRSHFCQVLWNPAVLIEQIHFVSGGVGVWVEGGSENFVVEGGVKGLEAFEVFVFLGKLGHVLGVIEFVQL